MPHNLVYIIIVVLVVLFLIWIARRV